jgi:DNA (cytosine-5)-methyltransferase 1
MTATVTADGPRIASLCTGYSGLDMAVQAVLGGEVAWVSDIDPGACKVIAHRHPGVTNIGDLTTADWQQILDTFGRPDIVTGGYPCQPFSLAGELKGTADERHIWPDIARALGVLRPRLAIFENVANHLRVGFDVVLADLADLGFDVEWCVVRADEVGAPHQRRRLIFIARSADTPGTGREGQDHQRRRPAGDGDLAADTANLGHEWGWGARAGGPGSADHDQSPADPASVGRGEGRAEPARQQGRLGAAERGGATPPDAPCGSRSNGTLGNHQLPIVPELGAVDRVGGGGAAEGTDESLRSAAVLAWGRYEPAIRRWERVIGRAAPRAVDDRNRLSPAFVEWLMGLPAGHVTDVPGLSRAQQLKALGNGVVPQQAEAAIRLLLARAFPARAAA